jgi:hypothetical protein
LNSSHSNIARETRAYQRVRSRELLPPHSADERWRVSSGLCLPIHPKLASSGVKANAFLLLFLLFWTSRSPAPEPGSVKVHSEVSPVLAQAFTEPFMVFSAKRFPGVPGEMKDVHQNFLIARILTALPSTHILM